MGEMQKADKKGLAIEKNKLKDTLITTAADYLSIPDKVTRENIRTGNMYLAECLQYKLSSAIEITVPHHQLCRGEQKLIFRYIDPQVK